MIRILSLAAIAAAAAVSPVAAQARVAAYYTATPTAAPAEASYVTSNTIWSCNGGTCVAQKAADRPQFVCERIAKSVGKLDSFSAGGEALDADALAKCNAKAR
ncbi:MAG: CC_3452 family protein [Sphingomonas sp.]